MRELREQELRGLLVSLGKIKDDDPLEVTLGGSVSPLTCITIPLEGDQRLHVSKDRAGQVVGFISDPT